MAVSREQMVARTRTQQPGDVVSDESFCISARAGPDQSPLWNELARAVECEVIPRLVAMERRDLRQRHHAAEAEGPRLSRPGPHPRADQVVECARLSLSSDPKQAEAFVETMHAEGTPVETVYLDLLAPAARHLGDLWSADICSFSEVTVGMMRLQQVMRVLSPSFQSEGDVRTGDARMLLTPVPGEQHSFGVFMVSEFFHRAGWRVASGPVASIDELASLVSGRWFAIAGLSVSSEAKLRLVARAIRAVRRSSRNPGIGVMVGGPIFDDHPEFIREIGADATAPDGAHAVTVADDLLKVHTRCA